MTHTVSIYPAQRKEPVQPHGHDIDAVEDEALLLPPDARRAACSRAYRSSSSSGSRSLETTDAYPASEDDAAVGIGSR